MIQSKHTLNFSTMNKILLGIITFVFVSGLWLMGSYNALVTLDENVNQKFAAVEVQYQRRFDLIPNVIKTVEGSANFEKSTLQAVVEARSAWANPSANTAEKITAANNFDSALSRLLVTVEAYPDIKSTQAFRDLTVELEGTENRVAFARNEYNETTTEYNKATRMFPSNIMATLFGFEKNKELFSATKGSETAPQVDFNIQ